MSRALTADGVSIVGRAFGPDGELGPASILAPPRPEASLAEVSAGCDPTRCLVAWSDGPDGVFHYRLGDRDGVPLGAAPVRPILRGNAQSVLAVAAGTSRHLVVVRDERRVGAPIRASRVTSAGSLDALSQALGAGDGPADAAFARGVFGVVWRAPGTDGLLFAGVAEEETSAPRAISIAPGSGATSPAISASGEGFFLVWARPDALVGARIAVDGTPIDESPLVLRGGAVQGADVVTWEEGHRVVWTEPDEAGVAAVWAQGFELDGAARGEPTRLPRGDGAQREPQIAAGDDALLVVWTEARPIGSAVRAARLGREGTVWDPDGLAIRELLDLGAAAPSVAFDGDGFVVVWHEARRGDRGVVGPVHLGARRVGLDGALGPVVRLGPRVAPCPSFGAPVIGGPLVGARTTETLVAACDFVAAPTVRARRAEVLPLRSLAELGAACDDDVACESGHCASGVCCDRACGGACEVCSPEGVCRLRGAETVCRPAADACDAPEHCTGERASCPFDRRGVCPPPMAGARDAGLAVDAGASSAASPGCGCRASREGAGEGPLLPLALLLLALFGRARR